MSTAPSTDWRPEQDLLAPVEVGAALVFVCRFPGCGRQFQLKGNLKRHQSIHRADKQFRCDVCGREFLRKADMEVHLRVHTGEKPYACGHGGCGKRFARRSDLLSHERTHSGEKPFECAFPGCHKRFARRFDLHKHQRMHADADDATPPPSMKRRLSSSSTVDNSKPPISPTDHADGPGKEYHLELKCTQDHVHSTPDCFSIEEWDALLGSSADCCPDHVQRVADSLASARLSPPRPLPPLPPPPPSHCAVVATAKLHDYAAHTGCGHLAIQHGDHRDFVVKNHLVCLDNVKSLSGDCGGGAACHSPPTKHHHPPVAPAAAAAAVAHAAQDPHRPGCGHLAVRHRDHIDYVVEDNLFCQHAGAMLEDADHIELLDDDFWDFYGAVGSLKTD